MSIATGRSIANKATDVLVRMIRNGDTELKVTFVTDEPLSIHDEYAEVTLREYPAGEFELVDSKALEKFGFDPVLSNGEVTAEETVFDIRGEYNGTMLGIRLTVPHAVLKGGDA